MRSHCRVDSYITAAIDHSSVELDGYGTASTTAYSRSHVLLDGKDMPLTAAVSRVASRRMCMSMSAIPQHMLVNVATTHTTGWCLFRRDYNWVSRAFYGSNITITGYAIFA
eukprot:scaffold8155_cov1425-Prasinococcus_capsulatus_cf.AAC.1